MNINKSKRKSIKASTSWVDAYEDFEEAAMKFFPDEEAMEDAVDTLYRVNRDDPGYQEAYKRWCETFTDEDREDAGLPPYKKEKEILYIIQDKHGKQLSAPNPDDSELWDRVASMEARGRRGLSVVVYNRNYVGSSSVVASRSNRSFTCPSCHNKTLYCTDHDVAKLADIDYHDQFVCDECGSCFLSEPDVQGNIRFSSCVESSEDVKGSDEYPCRTRTCSFATWLDEEHGLTEEEWEELPQHEADAIYDDYRGTMRIIRQGKSSVTSSEDFEDYEDEIQEIDQEFTSENTSINSGKLPAIFGLVHFEPGTINIDYGGGKFDNVAEYLTQYDVINLVYDPYNRSKEHNKEVLRTCKAAGGADTATCSNVLNVIKEPEVRKNVLENIKKIVKPTGTVYITVYEGSGKGNEGPTKSGYQLNRKTADYLEEIQQVFPDATRKGKLIVAHPSGSSVTSATIEAKLVDAPQDVIDELIEVLNSNGFILDPSYEVNPGRTWMGDIHMQVINPDSHVSTSDELRGYITDTLIDAIHAVEDKHDCPITWNFGANKAGQVTGGLDIMKKYVPDDEGSDIYSSDDILSYSDDELQGQIYDYLDTLGGYADYNQKIEEVVDEFGVSPDVAETYVCNWIQNSRAEWSDEADIEDDEIFGSLGVYRSTGAPREEDLPSGYWNPGIEDREEFDRRSLEESNRQEQDQLESLCYDAVSKCGGDVDDFRCHIVHNDGYDTVKIHFMSCVEGVLPRKFEDKAIKNLEDAFAKTRFNSHIRVHTASPRRWEIKDNFTNYLIDVYADAFDEELPFSSTVESATKKPKWWDSMFRVRVIEAYEKGELSFNNIDEWETKYNGGVKPRTSLGTREILKYYLDHPESVEGSEDILSADYGGAYDIDPHSYFTKDDIMEFAYDVADEFSTWAKGTYDVEDTYLENNRLYLSLWDNDEQVSYFAECAVDMRRIRRPSDLNKYKDCMLNKLKDTYNEYHVSDDEIISSTYDYPERPIDPPEYDEPSYETDECTIELDLDTVIIVDSDGSWEYEDEEYSFATNPDSKDGDWYSDEDEVHVIDPVGVVEQLDEFIEDRIPALPGRYRIKGKVTLVYDVEGIAVDYVYDSYDEDSYRDVVNKDNAEVTWNESKSSIDHIDITEE